MCGAADLPLAVSAVSDCARDVLSSLVDLSQLDITSAASSLSTLSSVSIPPPTPTDLATWTHGTIHCHSHIAYTERGGIPSSLTASVFSPHHQH